MIEHLFIGFQTIIEPVNLLILFVSLIMGLVFGTLPGLSGVMLCSLVLPFTYYMSPVQGLVMLVAIYTSSVYGGSITAILFRIPGAPENAATTFDGYPMTQKGKAAEALGVAILCSAIGGFLSVLILIVAAPQIAKFALVFGPPEFFGLCFFGLSIMTSLGTKSIVKGIIAGLVGMFIGTIGVTEMTGYPRYTFGLKSLYSGFAFIPIIIGVFAASQVFSSTEKMLGDSFKTTKIAAKFISFKEIIRIRWTIIRSAIIGFIIGALPMAGASLSAFISYNEAVRWSKKPELFGTGIIEGIAAPETANNATTGTAMVTLLALGIPGSVMTAIMLGAFQVHGIDPGPLLFIQHTDLVYTLFVAMLLGNIFIFVIGKTQVKIIVKLLNIDYRLLSPIILIFCAIGSFAIRNNIIDITSMFFFGVVGYFMRKFDYPIPAFVLGLILGPIAEKNYLLSMRLFDSDLLLFGTKPIAMVFIVLGVITLLMPIIRFYKQYRHVRKEQAAGKKEIGGN